MSTSRRLIVLCQRCGEVWMVSSRQRVKPCATCGAPSLEQRISAGPIGGLDGLAGYAVHSMADRPLDPRQGL